MSLLLVTGASGYLGREVVRRARAGGGDVLGTAHTQPGRRLDVRDAVAVERIFDETRPAAVIHTAYLQEGRDAWSTNVDGAEHVARAASLARARLIHVSSDVVFDGRLGCPYREEDDPVPVTEYGRSKAEAETRVAAAHPRALIVRTSLLYGGPGAEPGKHELAAHDPARTFYSDEIRSPVQVGDLALALLELLGADDLVGLLHVGGADAVSRAELAALITGRDVRTAPAPPGRPLDCRLDSSRARARLRTRLRGARTVLA